MVDLALLILRLAVGLTIAAHGAQKLFGWFGGPGMAGFTGWVENMNLRPGRLWAWASALAEFGGGLLLAMGFLTPLAAAIIIANMLMAVAKVHLAKGFWNTGGGYEYNLIIMAAALAIGLAGPGAYALDALVIGGGPQLQLFAYALLIGLAGVTLGLLVSERQPEATRQSR